MKPSCNSDLDLNLDPDPLAPQIQRRRAATSQTSGPVEGPTPGHSCRTSCSPLLRCQPHRTCRVLQQSQARVRVRVTITSSISRCKCAHEPTLCVYFAIADSRQSFLALQAAVSVLKAAEPPIEMAGEKATFETTMAQVSASRLLNCRRPCVPFSHVH